MFDYETMSLLGLFLVCFLSATILPFSSELAVVYFLNEGTHPIFSVLMVASLGNNPGTFNRGSVEKFRINCRPQFPQRVFQTASLYSINH